MVSETDFIVGFIFGFICLLIIICGYYIWLGYSKNVLQLSSSDDILKITNDFDFPIWVEGRYGNNGEPLPLAINQGINWDVNILEKYAGTFEERVKWLMSSTVIELPPKSSFIYHINPGGVAGLRVWAKFSCSPCGVNGEYATSPSVCLPPYPVGCASNNTCSFDGAGTNCVIGDSSQYYVPGENGGAIGGCPKKGCSVAVDSLFEATFGCKYTSNEYCNSNPSNPEQKLGPNTFFDTSNVDGYTFPYIVLVTSTSSDTSPLQYCIDSNKGSPMKTTSWKNTTAAYIDGSGLIMDDFNGTVGCPANADLSYGDVSSVTDSSLPVTYNLQNVNLGLYMDSTSGNITFPAITGDPDNGFTPVIDPPAGSVKVGCMSSCKRLNYGQPYGMNQSEACTPGLLYCCPTTFASSGCSGTTDCCDGISALCSQSTTNEGGKTGCITSSLCNQGPVVTSDYVKSIHNMAPGIYAFSYDDTQGLYQCGQNVQYEVIFGPAGSGPTNYWNNVWSTLHSNN